MLTIENRKLLVNGEAKPLVFIENFGFTHYPDDEIFKFIDLIKNNEADGFRVFGFYPWGKNKQIEPFLRISGSPFSGGAHYNLNQFDPKFFSHLHNWVSHAKTKDLLVHYTLFDSVGMKIPELIRYHPFGRFGNSFEDLTNPNNRDLLEAQLNYTRKIVSELKRYPNVLFEVCNEFWGGSTWHDRIAQEIKKEAPTHLIIASGEDTLHWGGINIFSHHKGVYSTATCSGDVRSELIHLKGKTYKVLIYSTDGFGTQGFVNCERNLNKMKDLAKQVKDAGIQIFSFLDHAPYKVMDETNREVPLGSSGEKIWSRSEASRANVEAWKTIVQEFKEPQSPIIKTYLAKDLPCIHPEAYIEGNTRAIKATKTQGFITFGPWETELSPNVLYKAYFSCALENSEALNMLNPEKSLVELDVFNASAKQVLSGTTIARRTFQNTKGFLLLNISFTAPKKSKLEFRVFYYGNSYSQEIFKIDKIYVCDPKIGLL